MSISCSISKSLVKEYYCSLETDLCDKFSSRESIPFRRTVRLDLRARLEHQLRCSPLSVYLLRKEVIQPQVPLRLPCYDFIPITSHTFGTCFPCGFAQRLRVQPAFMM